MLHAQSLGGRSGAGLLWLIAVAVGALIAALNIYVGGLLIVVASLLAATLLLRAPGASVVREMPRVNGTPMRQLTVATPAGAQQALLLPVAHTDGYGAVLTRDGYALINDEGRVVFSLTRE